MDIIRTRQEAIEIAKKVLADFGNRTFFNDTFKVSSPEENSKNNPDNLPFAYWLVLVNVPQEQFGRNDGVFSINIKDEIMEPFKFWDGGAKGGFLN